MTEYWEIPRDRGVVTLATWALAPTFRLRKLTLAQHTANVNALPVLAQTRADKARALTDALTAHRGLFATLYDLNIRVPGLVHNQLEADDELHGQLDDIYAIDVGQNQHDELRRARLVVGLWADFDAAQAAQTPPEPALTVKVDDAPLGQPAFAQLIADCVTSQQAVANAQRALTSAKESLHTLARRVDRDNKRWYGAWTKAYPVGTEEGDTARANVPTEDHVQAPTPLQIFSLTPHPDHTVSVVYAEGGGLHASKMKVLSQWPGEPEFGHEADVILDGQLIGPFPPNTLVGVRTRVSNSTPGAVWGDIVQVLIPA